MTTTYDEVQYQSYPNLDAHPDTLGVLAQLFGVTTAPCATMRLLEIGCGAGGNVLPLAAEFPSSTLLGVDLSAVAIAQAESLRQALGVANLTLRVADLTTLGRELGEFDYIIAHGVYSWVPPPVRERLLDLCGELLAPNGVAFISHNVLPGCEARTVARQLMLFAGRRMELRDDRLRRGRRVLDFVVNNIADDEARYRELMRGQLETTAGLPDWYLFHDYLSEHYFAEYFYQMVERFVPRGLQFLGDARFAGMLSLGLSPTAAQTLDTISADLIELEQYRDFIANRAFRQTVICRKSATIDREVSTARLANLCVASAARRVGDADEAGGEKWKSADGEIDVKTPFDRAMMRALTVAWPRYVTLDALASATLTALDQPATDATLDDASRRVRENIMRLFAADVVRLRRVPPQVASSASDGKAGANLACSALARLQATRGPAVTNQHHDLIRLRERERALVAALDGTRALPELAVFAAAELGWQPAELTAAITALGRAALLVDLP